MLEHLEHFAPPIYFCLILVESRASTPSLLSSPNPRTSLTEDVIEHHSQKGLRVITPLVLPSQRNQRTPLKEFK